VLRSIAALPSPLIRNLRTRRAIMEPMKHLPIGLLERYAMKEISIRDQQRVERHVTRCPECLDRLHGQAGWVLGVRLMDRFRKKFIDPPGKSHAKNQ
jgi:hypothetical protein